VNSLAGAEKQCHADESAKGNDRPEDRAATIFPNATLEAEPDHRADLSVPSVRLHRPVSIDADPYEVSDVKTRTELVDRSMRAAVFDSEMTAESE
jgi:hypothetical protein